MITTDALRLVALAIANHRTRTRCLRAGTWLALAMALAACRGPLEEAQAMCVEGVHVEGMEPLFVRGDFSGWFVRDDHALEYRDGCYRATLAGVTAGDVLELKIANRDWRAEQSFGARLPRTRLSAGQILELVRDSDAPAKKAANVRFRARSSGDYAVRVELRADGRARLQISAL